MRATFRPLPAWPYPPSAKQPTRFQSTWERSSRYLEAEVARLDGHDVVIGVVCDESQLSFSGALRANAKVGHPGAEVSFDVEGRGRLAFHTDAYATLHANLHAIALGLEALRAVDRYGITSGAEQYAGFSMLAPGASAVERGRELVTAAGGLTEALKRHHPDHGGQAADLAAVLAFKAAFAGEGRLMAGKKPVDPYSRVYWRAIDDDKFRGVVDDDRALATWIRLLLAADMAWPASASLYHGVSKVGLRMLVDARLVDLTGSGRFRIHGLDTERARRAQQAKEAAAARWEAIQPPDDPSDDDAGAPPPALPPHMPPHGPAPMRPHTGSNAASNAETMPSRAEPSKDEQRRDETSREETREGFATKPRAEGANGAGGNPPINGRGTDEEALARARARLADPTTTAAIRDVAAAEVDRLVAKLLVDHA